MLHSYKDFNKQRNKEIYKPKKVFFLYFTAFWVLFVSINVYSIIENAYFIVPFKFPHPNNAPS